MDKLASYNWTKKLLENNPNVKLDEFKRIKITTDKDKNFHYTFDPVIPLREKVKVVEIINQNIEFVNKNFNLNIQKITL